MLSAVSMESMEIMLATAQLELNCRRRMVFKAVQKRHHHTAVGRDSGRGEIFENLLKILIAGNPELTLDSGSTGRYSRN